MTNAQSPIPPDVATAATEIRSLMCATEWDSLVKLTNHWHKDLTVDQRKELIVQLVNFLPSARELKLSVPDNVWLTAREEIRKLPPGGLTERRSSERISQDLLRENGRAAWALEELLYCDLPLPEKAGAEPSPQYVAKVTQYVVQAMVMPPVDGVGTDANRVRLAVDWYAPAKLLRHLAHDPSPLVRAAVADSAWTPAVVIELLAKDPDAEVRHRAEGRLRTDGTLESILGLKWVERTRAAATSQAALQDGQGTATAPSTRPSNSP